MTDPPNLTKCVCPPPEQTGLTVIRVSWCPIHGPGLRQKRKPKLQLIKGGRDA